jgi:methionyl aminopeptidase
MIIIKSEREIELIEKACKATYDTLKYLEEFIKPGITTKELDKIAEDYIRKIGCIPALKNYDGFPASICTSVNDQVVHGIPGNYKLKEGDIISIDMSLSYKGYYSDSARTYPVGKISDDKKYLLEHTEECLYEGIKQVKPGNRIGDISSSIEKHARKYNLGIVRELVGHGVGTKLHEEPDIPNYGNSDTGPILKPGMILAIEPMLNLGGKEVFMEEDDWTISTCDGSPSAHFEHTVLVTEDGYRILTER